MIVKVPTGLAPKPIKIESKIISEETLLEVKDVRLKVKFFWDSHGKEIPFPGFNNENSFAVNDVDVTITKVIKVMCNIEFEIWKINVPQVPKLRGQVESYSYSPSTSILRVKLMVGTG